MGEGAFSIWYLPVYSITHRQTYRHSDKNTQTGRHVGTHFQSLVPETFVISSGTGIAVASFGLSLPSDTGTSRHFESLGVSGEGVY